MQKILSKNKTLQKFISCLVIISILSPAIFMSFQPKKAEAQWVVIDPAHIAVSVKAVLTEIWKQAMMALARKLLARFTQNTVNWINSGFHGNPLYLENPKSFFKDIAKYEIRTLVTIFGYDSRRYPFGRSWSMDIINNFKRRLEDNAAYTLHQAITDPLLLQRYRTDLATAGWN